MLPNISKRNFHTNNFSNAILNCTHQQHKPINKLLWGGGGGGRQNRNTSKWNVLYWKKIKLLIVIRITHLCSFATEYYCPFIKPRKLFFLYFSFNVAIPNLITHFKIEKIISLIYILALYLSLFAIQSCSIIFQIWVLPCLEFGTHHLAKMSHIRSQHCILTTYTSQSCQSCVTRHLYTHSHTELTQRLPDTKLISKSIQLHSHSSVSLQCPFLSWPPSKNSPPFHNLFWNGTIAGWFLSTHGPLCSSYDSYYNHKTEYAM